MGSIAKGAPISSRRRSFSALRRAVLGSITPERGQTRPPVVFQCSPTSRVGVNASWFDQSGRRAGLFQCSPTSRVGVNAFDGGERAVGLWVSVLSDEPCWGQSKPGSPDPGFVARFQCSPTSRVGVNRPCTISPNCLHPVSVLSDEPCWGQLSARRTQGACLTCVSVLSDEPCWGQSSRAAQLDERRARFQCSPTSRVGVNRHRRPAQLPRYEFQCSPTSRVGVNPGRS